MRNNGQGKRIALASVLAAVAVVAITYQLLASHDPSRPDAAVKPGATPVLRGSGEPLPGQGSMLPTLANKR